MAARRQAPLPACDRQTPSKPRRSGARARAAGWVHDARVRCAEIATHLALRHRKELRKPPLYQRCRKRTSLGGEGNVRGRARGRARAEASAWVRVEAHARAHLLRKAARLRERVQALHTDSRGTHGSSRLHAALRREGTRQAPHREILRRLGPSTDALDDAAGSRFGHGDPASPARGRPAAPLRAWPPVYERRDLLRDPEGRLVYKRRRPARLDLRAATFECIEVFCNRQRPHSSISNKTPAEIEGDYRPRGMTRCQRNGEIQCTD